MKKFIKAFREYNISVDVFGKPVVMTYDQYNEIYFVWVTKNYIFF